MKYKILTFVTVVFITILIILFLEIFLKFIFLKDNGHYTCYEKVEDERIYTNGKNCNFVVNLDCFNISSC